jgi:VanZ family protein
MLWVPPCVAWLLAGLIVIWTWGPVGLRPGVGHPQLERFFAYFFLAVALTAAYPSRKRLIAVAVVAAAIVLEIGQAFIPGRDAGVADALAKMAGGMLGVLLAPLTRAVLHKPSAR